MSGDRSTRAGAGSSRGGAGTVHYTRRVAQAKQPRPTVYLHIGPPKTGTSYLQAVLRAGHDDLLKEGVLYPHPRRYSHFGAALDARGDHGHGFGPGRDIPRKGTIGAWPRMVERVTRFDGTVVISHELFSTANDDHVRAIKRDLAGTDLHVVVTSRDPARQLVSAWQERLKHGDHRKFETIERSLHGRGRFPGPQNIPNLLQRWADGLPADHVHIVTVPAGSSDPEELWRRFAAVVGVRPEAVSARPTLANTTLGIAEAELLRRVQEAIGDRLQHPARGRIVSKYYANTLLAAHSRSPRPTLPERLLPDLEKLADEWITAIRDGGYDVSGDLDDLRPRPPKDGSDTPAEADIVAAAVASTADLLLEINRLRRPGVAARSLRKEAVQRTRRSARRAVRRVRSLLRR